MPATMKRPSNDTATPERELKVSKKPAAVDSTSAENKPPVLPTPAPKLAAKPAVPATRASPKSTNKKSGAPVAAENTAPTVAPAAPEMLHRWIPLPSFWNNSSDEEPV